MAEVIVLRSGYADADRSGTAGGQRAACTISLVRDAVSVLVDTGGPAESSLLVGLLERQALGPEQVAYIVCTHGHVDHVSNNNLFPHATFFAGRDRSTGDRYTRIDYADGPVSLSANISLIPTPGHTSEDISVLVTTKVGVIAIVGDLFEHADDASDESWRLSTSDAEVQRASRARILQLADVIVPGHGASFRVTRSLD